LTVRRVLRKTPFRNRINTFWPGRVDARCRAFRPRQPDEFVDA
jgi:hypothetical protein